MDSSRNTSDQSITCRDERRGARLECRECEVICESVVSPWRCLKARNMCVYAFKDGDSTYFGCLHKVFSPELDLRAFSDEGQGGAGGSDPYGPLRVAREPRPQCPVSVERAYCGGSAGKQCVNPGFLRDMFRVVRRGEGMHPAGGSFDDHRRTS
jgi:hypothetical protein